MSSAMETKIETFRYVMNNQFAYAYFSTKEEVEKYNQIARDTIRDTFNLELKDDDYVYIDTKNGKAISSVKPNIIYKYILNYYKEKGLQMPKFTSSIKTLIDTVGRENKGKHLYFVRTSKSVITGFYADDEFIISREDKRYIFHISEDEVTFNIKLSSSNLGYGSYNVWLNENELILLVKIKQFLDKKFVTKKVDE